MVEETDVAAAVIDAQFRKFVKERIHTTKVGDVDSVPEEVYRMALTTAYLDMFLGFIEKSARYN